MVRALGKDPSEWEPDDLTHITDLEFDLTALRAKVIQGLRESGYNDKQIGEALGITQQAVSKRWPGGGRFVGAAGRYRTSTTTN